MATVRNPHVLYWKHKAEGISTKQNDQGEMEITGWPAFLGSMPTQAEVDAWEAEYEAEEKPRKQAQKELENSDRNLSRRLEDLYQLTMSKGIFTEAEVEAASPGLVAKMAERKANREKLKKK